jgi:putative flippase GtrA
MGAMAVERKEAGTIFRFLLVGGSFSLGYAITTAGLINLAAAPPLLTSVLVYLLCIPLAFLAQRNFAFRTETRGLWAFAGYAGTQVFSLIFVSSLTSRHVSNDFVLDAVLYLVTAGAAAAVSYLICRYIIFR